MRKLRLSTRLFMLVALSVVIMVAAMVMSLRQNYSAVEAERKSALAAMDANAVSLLKMLYEQEQSGAMTREQAQAEAKRMIGAMRYDNGNGYFWINDMHPRMIMHPVKPELNGKDLTQNKDPNGKFLFVEFVKTVKASGQGFVDYDWPKPGAEKPVGKYSHVIGFEPWGWIIGTGVYVDDLRAAFINKAISNLLIVGGGLLVLAVVAYRIVRGVTGPINRMRDALSQIANGDANIKLNADGFGHELGQMARSIAILQDAVNERAGLQSQAAEQQRAIAQDREAAAHEARTAAENQARAMAALGNALEALANGNLAAELEDLGADYAKLRGDFNRAVSALRATIEQISATGRVVNSNAADISDATTNLSRRTEQQAAALEQTAAALEEITATVKTASERAAEASTMVAETKQSASRSGAIVRDAIQAMGRIEDSSSRIGQIIGVIDEIAFQTNLLALNAGVEAARAGEAGRGFAVVAQEVRELAQRSANAAKEIKQLIQNSAQEVGAGVSLVRTTGEALVEIEQQVERVNLQVQGIATASREQATGIQEINASVSHMDQMTQQNAAMVQETTVSSQTLEEQSKQLQALLSRFELGGKAAASKYAA